MSEFENPCELRNIVVSHSRPRNPDLEVDILCRLVVEVWWLSPIMYGVLRTYSVQ